MWRIWVPFLKTCRSLCKPGGLLILSTLNRTAKSYGLAIFAAERVLGLVPPGTHDWNKFIKPEEILGALADVHFKEMRRSGVYLNPIAGAWELSATDVSVDYILSAEAISVRA